MKKSEKKRIRLEEIINNIKYDANSYRIKDLTDNDITELATGICDELEAELPSEEEIYKMIEKHKWNTAKYVLENKTLDVGQSSKDLAKAIFNYERPN